MSLRFFLKNGILYYRDTDGKSKSCVHKTDVRTILTEYHDGAVGGYFGRDITIARVRQDFWWPTLWRDSTEFVKTCDRCQRYGPVENHNELHPYRPVFPFEFIFIDFIINLPITSKRNRHIITMTDGLTKWIEAKAYREATAKNAANFLMENIILRFGAPITVITDNGSHFKGEFHELCQRLNIQHWFSTTYHPQTVGQDERSNGLLLDRIRKWRREEDKKWDDDLTSSIFACNTRRISTMNASAMETLMGYTAQTASKLKHNPISKQELSHKLASISNPDPDVTTQERLRILETFRDEVIRVRDFNQDKIKHRYDSKIRSKAFTV